MSLKNRILTNIVNAEGGFVDNPNDSGCATNFGITEKVARHHGYTGVMRDMEVAFAFTVYSNVYWHSVNGDELIKRSESVTAEVVDTGVNCGPRTAVRMLQRSLNVLNGRNVIYLDLKADGIAGAATLNALSSYLRERDEETLVKMLNVLQGAHYVELAERREKDESFIYGWFKNRIKL